MHDIEPSESLLSIEVHTSQADARLYVPLSLATGSLGRLTRPRWTTTTKLQSTAQSLMVEQCTGQ